MKANIEVDLPPDFEEKVEELKNSLGFTNNAEVLYYAVTFLSRINAEQKKGNKIVVPPPKQYPVSGATTTIKAEWWGG